MKEKNAEKEVQEIKPKNNKTTPKTLHTIRISENFLCLENETFHRIQKRERER
jgi:hypothetical protein